MHPQEAHKEASEQLREEMEKIRHKPHGSVTLTMTKRNGEWDWIDSSASSKRPLSSGT